MQRYRINHRLVVSLFIGTLVLGALAFFLQSWQVNRKAGSLRTIAQQNLEDGDCLSALQMMKDYARLRPDEDDARIELGDIALEVINFPEADLKQRVDGWNVLDDVVRRTGASHLRRELAKLILLYQPPSRVVDAIEHLEELLLDNPGDPELNKLQVQALYRSKDFRSANTLAANLIGYNTSTGQFDDDKVVVGDQPEIYALLAQSLLQNVKIKEACRKVIDRMVEVNAESPIAHLRRSAMLNLLEEPEEAAAALDRAYVLDPLDAEILSRKGYAAIRKKEYDAAAAIFNEALEKHPEDVRFHTLLAQTEFSRANYDEAVAIAKNGIRKFTLRQTVGLSMLLIDVHLINKDEEAVNKAVKELKKLNVSAYRPYIDYVEARLAVTEKRWREAVDTLTKVLPQLDGNPLLQAKAGVLAGFCHEQLGHLDLAKAAYTVVLRASPGFQRAVEGIERIDRILQPEKTNRDGGINLLVNQMLARPEAEQDWSVIDRAVEKTAENFNFSETQANVVRAQVYIKRQMFEEAEKIIAAEAKREPDDLQVQYTAVTLISANPKKGPAKAMVLLDRIVAKTGSTLQSRNLRAQLLLAMDLEPERLLQQLMALAEGVDEWPEQERVALYAVMVTHLQQMGKFDEVNLLWKRVLELRPNNLPLQMQQFQIAFEQQDDETMQEAQNAILEIVKVKTNPSYILTEIKRMMAGFISGRISRKDLATARKLLDDAVAQRPQWHELHIVYGQLLSILKEDPLVAIEHFENALAWGPPNPAAVAQHITLLAAEHRYASARKKMELLPKAFREHNLGNLEAIILWQTGEKEAAYESAKNFASLRQDDIEIQVWFSEFAQQAEKVEAAIAAMHRATDLEPARPSHWTRLADLYWKSKNGDLVQQTLRSAQLAVDAEFIPILEAKAFEVRGQLQFAEDLYLAIYSDRLDQVSISRRMAEFYILWGNFVESQRVRAFSHINRILRAANEGRVPANNRHIAWARNKAARYLASTNDYQQSVKAERLLTSGLEAIGQSSGESGGPNDSRAQQLLLAEILASQRGPKSQLRAIEILENLRERSTLEKKHILLLGNLLNRINDWEGCESLLTDALAKHQNDSLLWSAYIDTLIDQREYTKANLRLKTLAEIGPDVMTFMRLRARLAAAQGNQAQVRQLLKRIAPVGPGAVTPAQLKMVLTTASLATQYNDNEFAEQLLRFYVNRRPNSTGELTSFLAMYGDYEEAFGMLEQQFATNTEPAMSLALQMLRKRRAAIGNRFDEVLDKMFASAIREDPDSYARRTMRAELFEVQQKYDRSIEAYDELLILGDDMPLQMRASVMNNLGYLLALKNIRLDEAIQLVNKAMDIYGPIDDMLDTRAVVRIARKEYDLAAEDMKLAVSISRDPVKYYHLALAQLLAGNDAAALTSWKQAKKWGFEVDKLGFLEQSAFQDFEKQVELLQ
ncbi:MAG: tetratricopeptide repeat protein [Pirellulales bacterium]|nr:tetratricopeptide repeat protein [Pirellulales bacterium]